MLKIDIYNLISDIIPKENIAENEDMSRHVSFRTGGNARYFVSPTNEKQITELVNVLKDNRIPHTVIGNGSNLLVSDKGYYGVIVEIGKNMSDIRVDGEIIEAMAGALLSRISSVALSNSLAGFEFASGIPGSLGGAVVMNAGAYGGEIKDVVASTRYISSDGTVKTVTGDEHGFGYRKSIFGSGDVVLSSQIKLKSGNKADIKALCDDLNSRRREKQPIEFPSAGSTFKRPEGYFAAKLIDDAGLRGRSVGGAMVSEKHTGFVINYDNATSSDVYELMKVIKETVYEKFGVTLEPEVRLIGEF